MTNPTVQRRQRNLDIIYETEHLALSIDGDSKT
jgi:hypothetical protein